MQAWKIPNKYIPTTTSNIHFPPKYFFFFSDRSLYLIFLRGGNNCRKIILTSLITRFVTFSKFNGWNAFNVGYENAPHLDSHHLTTTVRDNYLGRCRRRGRTQKKREYKYKNVFPRSFEAYLICTTCSHFFFL